METTSQRTGSTVRLSEEVLEYCKKGKEVIVNGQMRSSQWEDKQGNKRSSWELVANEVVFKKTMEAPEAPQAPRVETDDEEIPF